MTIPYRIPRDWMRYDLPSLLPALASAKAAVISLTQIPYQRAWAEKLQHVQLKREVAGTSRIEGADFTERELDAALADDLDALSTRSQRQAAAAVRAYRWIAGLPNDYPVGRDAILEIHRLIVCGADDDHCPPGKLRGAEQNVTFGIPRHRGVDGGKECQAAFDGYCSALGRQMAEHDPLIHALAAHYHFAAMHPFLDGNGRTARAIEALLLQRCGLRDTLFIAMSNYYYEEKNAYLRALAEVRARNNDLTPFLEFGLRGIELQCSRLLEEIRVNLSKALFRNQMYDLFNRLENKRKRVIAERQLTMLKLLLERDMGIGEFTKATLPSYVGLKNPEKAWTRDLGMLLSLKAIGFRNRQDGPEFFARLDWPTEITETEFFRVVNEMPKAKTHKFLDH